MPSQKDSIFFIRPDLSCLYLITVGKLEIAEMRAVYWQKYVKSSQRDVGIRQSTGRGVVNFEDVFVLGV
jgi:hypothetical protein